MLRGSVGVYLDDEMAKCVGTVGINQTFGERALKDSEPRTGSCVAHAVTVCLVLSANDYRDQMFHTEFKQKMARMSFL